MSNYKKHFPSGTPAVLVFKIDKLSRGNPWRLLGGFIWSSWGLVGDQNVKQPLAQDLFLKMSRSRINTKWCEFVPRSHGCRYGDACWHAHTQAEYDKAHADDPPDPPGASGNHPLEQTIYSHRGYGPGTPAIHRTYSRTSLRSTTPRQHRHGSFDVRLNGRSVDLTCMADVRKATKLANGGDAGADDADDNFANDADAAGADDGAAHGSDDSAANGVRFISLTKARRSCSMVAMRKKLNKMPQRPGIWLHNAMTALEKAAAAAKETDSDDAVVFNHPTVMMQ